LRRLEKVGGHNFQVLAARTHLEKIEAIRQLDLLCNPARPIYRLFNKDP